MSETDEPQFGFTGFFIPVEIIQMEELSWSERILLSMIDAYSKGPNGCFASNAHFAKKLNISDVRVSHMITDLKRMDLIEEIAFDGRKRYLACKKSEWYSGNSKKESWSKVTTPSSQKRQVSIVKNDYHIEKPNIKSKNPPPSPPPKKSKTKEQDAPLNASLDEEGFTSKREALKEYDLPGKTFEKFAKFSLEEIRVALEKKKGITATKSSIGLLLDILRNPKNYPELKQLVAQNLTKQQILALQHNELIRHKGYEKLANENEKLVVQEEKFKLFEHNGRQTQISLKDSDNPNLKGAKLKSVMEDIKVSDNFLKTKR